MIWVILLIKKYYFKNWKVGSFRSFGTNFFRKSLRRCGIESIWYYIHPSSFLILVYDLFPLFFIHAFGSSWICDLCLHFFIYKRYSDSDHLPKIEVIHFLTLYFKHSLYNRMKLRMNLTKMIIILFVISLFPLSLHYFWSVYLTIGCDLHSPNITFLHLYFQNFCNE